MADGSRAAESLALGVEYDSVQGRYALPVKASVGNLHVGGQTLELTQADRFEDLDWATLGVQLVVDCSGEAKQLERAKVHLERGASQVLVSNPVRGVPNLVLTPHVGYVSRENMGVFYRQMVENIAAFQAGAPIRRLTPDAPSLG